MCDNILRYISRTEDGIEETMHQTTKITNRLADSIYLDVSVAQDHFEVLSSQIEEMLEAKMILEEKCIGLANEKEVLLAKNEKLSNELAMERSNGKESKEALTDLGNKYTQLQEKNAISEKLIQELSNTLKEKDETLHVLEEEAILAHTLSDKLKEITDESKELRETLRSKESIMNELEEQLTTSQDELSTLRSKCNVFEEEKSGYFSIKEDLESKCFEQESDLKSTKKELAEKSSKLREYQHLTDNLSTQRANLEMEIAILKANYQKAIEEVTHDACEIMKQKETIAELKALAEEQTQLVKSLSKDLTLHKQYNADLQEDVTLIEQELETTKEALSVKQKEYSLIKEQYQKKQIELKSVISQYEASSEKYENQILAATRDLENASLTIADLVNQQLATIDENAERQKKMLTSKLCALRDLNEEHRKEIESDAIEQKKIMIAIMDSVQG